MSNKKIFIVEDEIIVISFIEKMLQEHDYEVVGSASKGQEAIQKIKRTVPDIILMDINLGSKIDGIEVAEQIKKKIDIPVVFMTGYSDQETLERAKLVEPFGYILKPIKIDQLLTSIEIALYKHKVSKKLTHLNAVLDSIRSVNQIIVREKNPDRLIQKICDNITRTRGFQTAKIVLMDRSGRIDKFASSGMDEGFTEFIEMLKRGDNIFCIQESLEKSEVILIEKPSKTCDGCPLNHLYVNSQKMVAPLAHENEFYGILIISLPENLKIDIEERKLMKEFAEDISFALHNIDVEQKREAAEQALKESEELHRLTLSNISDAVFITDDQGEFTFICPNTSFIFGYTVQEVREKFNIHNLLGEDEFDPDDLKEKEEIRNIEREVLDRHGKSHILLVTVKKVSIREGTLLYTCRDVTELKEVEENLKKALEESNRRREEVTALLRGTKAVLNYRDFHRAAEEIFNSCKELIGATSGYVALLSEDGSENEVLFLDSGGLPCTVDPDLPMPIRGLRSEAYKYKTVVYENNFEESDWMKYMPAGHVALKNVLFAPLVLEGEVVGLLGLANKKEGFDESDGRLATAFGEIAAIALQNSYYLEMLKENEERYRWLIETIPEAIILEKNRELVYVNQSAYKLFGEDFFDSPGDWALTDLLSRKQSQESSIPNISYTYTEQILPSNWVDVKFEKDGQEKDLEIIFRNNIYHAEPAMLIIARDVTEIKSLRQKTQRMQYLATLGELSATVAHEVRNPLGSIGLDWEFLADKLDIHDKYNDTATRIDTCIERIQRVVEGILDFARPVNPQMAWEDIHTVLNNSIFCVQQDFEQSNIEIVRNFVESKMPVFVDFNQMVQIFVNLFQNANQAMSEGGKLFITTHSENGDVDVEIEDTGEGIPPENLERIFAPFFTTRTEGTGLGLAVISRILEQHNAQISVESQIGIGTKFTVRLPAK